MADSTVLQGVYNGTKVKLVKDPHAIPRIVRGVEFPVIYNIEVNGKRRSEAIESFFRDLGERNIFKSLLNTHGQVVIQNLGSTEAEVYSKVVDAAFGKFHHPYVQVGVLGAPRKDVSDNVTTVNPASGPKTLYGHQEFSRFKEFPTLITFFSQATPPANEKGHSGQSTTLHATELFDRVNAKYPEFINALNEKGVYLSQTWANNDDLDKPIESSWVAKYAFGKDIIQHDNLETRKSKALNLAKQRVSEDAEFLEDNTLKVHQHTKPIRIHPYNNWPIIFSSLPTYYSHHYFDRSIPSNIRYDNGESIPEEFLDYLFEQSVDIEYTHEYKNGDLILIDNYSVYHGRKPFEGKRDVLASFWDEFKDVKQVPREYVKE